MEEREIILSKLNARQKLASLSEEKLLSLAEDSKEFDYLMGGLARCMSPSFVCYAYRYNDILREMIKKNMARIGENEELSQNVYKILGYLDEYDSKGAKFRSDFTPQYEYIFMASLGLNKLGVSLESFDKNALDMFDRIENLEIAEIKNNEYYLATVSYLVHYHPEYLKSSHVIFSIQNSLHNVNRNDFDNGDKYKAFKKVANMNIKKLQKYSKNNGKKLLKTK